MLGALHVASLSIGCSRRCHSQERFTFVQWMGVRLPNVRVRLRSDLMGERRFDW
jgi:hypothetical protein